MINYLLGLYLLIFALLRVCLHKWPSALPEHSRTNCWIRWLSKFPLALVLFLPFIGLFLLDISLYDDIRYYAISPQTVVIGSLLLLIIASAVILTSRRQLMRYRVALLYIGVIVLLIIPLLPYAIIKLNTVRFGYAMKPVVQEVFSTYNNGSDRVNGFSVLRKTPQGATVYLVMSTHAVSPPYSAGRRAVVFEVVRQGNAWAFCKGSDNILWADFGSAEDEVFPPLR